MRIVCIAASFVPSRTANSIQVMKATHALAESGHQVTLFVPGNTTRDFDEIRDQYGLTTPFKVEWIPENLVFRRYDFALKAIHQARRLKPDLVYTMMLQAGVLAVWSGIPAILELHDRVTGKLGPWLFTRFVRSKTPHKLLTNTKALKDLLINDFDLDPSEMEILVAPNGVELSRYQNLSEPETARRILNLPQGFTAGYTGHFYQGRGMELMFSLAKRMPDIRFLWVGGQPADVNRWQQRLQEEGVENVVLTGFVDNAVLPQYQAASDVLLMPYGMRIAGSGGGDSSDIASPMKMFEYMAAERAIITSDLPVFHEVLNEEMAVFCPPEDPQTWEAALRAMLSDPVRRESLARTARSAVGNYTWQARAKRALAGWIE